MKQQTAFGSHDLQSQAVISTLKKVTFGLQKRTGGREKEEEEEEEESSSLDAPMVNRVANRCVVYVCAGRWCDWHVHALVAFVLVVV